jgi:hypothetical protein
MVVLAALAVMMAALPIPAQEQPTTWAAKMLKDDTGKIPPGHNFGTVPRGAMLQHRFPITNIYAVPFTIFCESTCGCVSVTPTERQPMVLQPKQTGYIDVSMDTTRFNTPQKSVTVNVYVRQYDRNPQFWSSASLVMQGLCRGDVEMAPAQASFGIVPQRQAPAPYRDLQVRYRGGQQDWQITGPTADQAVPFDVRYQKLYGPVGQAVYKVTLALKDDTPPGSYKGDIRLATNDRNNPTIAIPYDVNVQAPLTVLPSDIVRLPALKVGEETQRMVYVKSGQPFRIVGVDGQGDGITAQARPDAAPTQVLTIKVQPTQAGPVQKTLTIRTDLNGGATTTIKIEATANQ